MKQVFIRYVTSQVLESDSFVFFMFRVECFGGKQRSSKKRSMQKTRLGHFPALHLGLNHYYPSADAATAKQDSPNGVHKRNYRDNINYSKYSKT